MESLSVQAKKPRPDLSLGETPCRRQDLPAREQEAIARPGLAVYVALAVVSPQAPRPLRSSPAEARGSQAGSSGPDSSRVVVLLLLPQAASRARGSVPHPANGSAGTRPLASCSPDSAAAAPAVGPAHRAWGDGVGAEAWAGEEAGLRPRPQARFRRPRRARRGPWEAWPAGAGAAQPGTFRNCRRGRRESPSRGGRSAESKAEIEPPRRARPQPPAAAEPVLPARLGPKLRGAGHQPAHQGPGTARHGHQGEGRAQAGPAVRPRGGRRREAEEPRRSLTSRSPPPGPPPRAPKRRSAGVGFPGRRLCKVCT